jgi:hypothetical protein
MADITKMFNVQLQEFHAHSIYVIDILVWQEISPIYLLCYVATVL